VGVHTTVDCHFSSLLHTNYIYLAALTHVVLVRYGDIRDKDLIFYVANLIIYVRSSAPYNSS
jgi:hypothetical protein